MTSEFEHIRPSGLMIVVDARADMRSGILGEKMLTDFAGRGGAGVVVDRRMQSVC
jgi:regulator of RNase E activity RraA